MSVITQYKFVQDEPINPWHQLEKKVHDEESVEKYTNIAVNNELGKEEIICNGHDVEVTTLEDKTEIPLTKVEPCGGSGDSPTNKQTENENIGFQKQELGFAMKAIHAGQKPELWQCKSVVPPIYMSTSYKKQDFVQTAEQNYYDNPTRTVLEETLAALDNGKYCLSFLNL